jgi:hypothetical protein
MKCNANSLHQNGSGQVSADRQTDRTEQGKEFLEQKLR